MKCECSLEADRDVIGNWNIKLKALKMWGVSVPPKSQPMKPEAGSPSATSVAEVTKVVEGQNGVPKYKCNLL